MCAGSKGEQELQEKYGTGRRARAFYDRQVRSELNSRMRDFIAEQEMFFVATADLSGNCDCSFRAGPPGFVRVLSNKTLLYPELAGNGVMASLGNIPENPHIAIIFMDFSGSRVGLHVNGRARIVENEEASRLLCEPSAAERGVRSPELSGLERWVEIDIEEVYMHCARHVPAFVRQPGMVDWSRERSACKKQDYFAG